MLAEELDYGRLVAGGERVRELLHLRLRQRLERLHQPDVLFQVLDGWQPDHGAGDGQRQRIVEQVPGGGFGLAGQRVPGEDVHGNDAHVLTLSHWKRQRLEALVAGRYGPGGADHIRHGSVESYLATIEIVPLESQFHGCGGVMAANTDETRELLFASFLEGLEHAAFGLDARQVVL